MLKNINFNRNFYVLNPSRINITPIFIGVCLVFSTCFLRGQNNKRLEEITENLKSGQIYDEINLSYLHLTEMPDLSAYSIKKLNLSYNDIVKFMQEFLPSQLENLNISHNRIEPILQYKECKIV